MPCYDPPMWVDEFGTWHDGERPKSWCDKMVRLLCEANQMIDNLNGHLGWVTPYSLRSKELAEWWKAHQRWDAQRTKELHE